MVEVRHKPRSALIATEIRARRVDITFGDPGSIMWKASSACTHVLDWTALTGLPGIPSDIVARAYSPGSHRAFQAYNIRLRTLFSLFPPV